MNLTALTAFVDARRLELAAILVTAGHIAFLHRTGCSRARPVTRCYARIGVTCLGQRFPMTTRSETPPASAARTLHWLALPLLLLVGCASAPFSNPDIGSDRPAPVAVTAPEPAKNPDAAAATATPRRDGPGHGGRSRRRCRSTRFAPTSTSTSTIAPHASTCGSASGAASRCPISTASWSRERERWYASRPDYVARMTERGGRYLFHIVEELDKRGMPTELALLPFIESAYNPQAMSVARASGMWQFIPSTGRDFELKQNVFRDDRRDVLASTRAALDYLQKLYGMFGDWQLALAAYNWGEGSVQRAIAKNQRAGLPTDYQSLRMPAETQGYVPKLQAVKNIVANPASFNLTLPELFNHPYFLSVPIERDIDVALAVQLAGVPLEEFQSLNPQMNRPVILAAGTPQLLLPYDNANRFVRELPQHRGPLATWTAWQAPKTMKPAEAAHAVGMNEEQFREVNHIPARVSIKAGSTCSCRAAARSWPTSRARSPTTAR